MSEMSEYGWVVIVGTRANGDEEHADMEGLDVIGPVSGVQALSLAEQYRAEFAKVAPTALVYGEPFVYAAPLRSRIGPASEVIANWYATTGDE